MTQKDIDTLALDEVLKVQNASIYQRQSLILSNVNFELEKGEFLYLIGRTGSGKSSLLKTLYADIPLKKGSMEVVGYQIQGIKHKEIPYLRRKVGIIFQDFQLLSDRNVGANLFFVMEATGWHDKAKMKRRIQEVLNQVGLEHLEGKMPHQLSGGEQQRLAIARALLNRPLVLFADEPTGNLDPEVSGDILQLFLNINKEGMAVIMATHNHYLIKKYPARTLKCEQGQVREVDKI